MADAELTIRPGLDIDDPFDVAFPMAVDAARRFCAGRHDPDSLCFLYHSLWPRLRRIGCTGSAWLHVENYVDTFRRLAALGGRRILVTGTADYSLTAFLIHAFRAEGVEPEITVLDICDAPLTINRWYATRHDCRITTVKSDLVDFDDDRGFDVISTDNLLGRFPPKGRSTVVGKWRALLRQAGALVIAQRISFESSDSGEDSTLDPVTRKLQRICAQAQKHSDVLDISTKQLVHDAARYYETRRMTAVSSVDEIVRLFAAQGLQIQAVYDPAPHNPDCRRTGGLSRATRHVAFVASQPPVSSASGESAFDHGIASQR